MSNNVPIIWGDVDGGSQPFSKQGQSDWLASVKRLELAKARLWKQAPLQVRQAILQLVDDEQKGQQ